jgi:mutator protein MutT
MPAEAKEAQMLDVTAAILVAERKVLIARRSPRGHEAGLWEFPGGKVKPGETPEQGLRREIREELGVDIRVGKFFAESVYADGRRTIRLLAYHAQLEAGTPVPFEHDQIAWVTAGELADYVFSPADRPLVAQLRKVLWAAADR